MIIEVILFPDSALTHHYTITAIVSGVNKQRSHTPNIALLALSISVVAFDLILSAMT